MTLTNKQFFHSEKTKKISSGAYACCGRVLKTTIEFKLPHPHRILLSSLRLNLIVIYFQITSCILQVCFSYVLPPLLFLDKVRLVEIGFDLRISYWELLIKMKWCNLHKLALFGVLKCI